MNNKTIVTAFLWALPLAAQFPIVIDAGGPGDQYFSPKNTCAAGGTCTTTNAAMGDAPMNTQRFGFGAAPFTYAVPLPNGLYDVVLGFAEPSKTKPGQRVFTATVQGEASAPIDLVKLTGGPNFPYFQTWAAVNVRAGMLTMTFAPAPGNGANAVVNSITISPAAPNTVPVFVDSVQPTGAIDGLNATFLLPTIPNPANSVDLYLNGIYQTQGIDYSLAGAAIIMVVPPALTGKLTASYRASTAVQFQPAPGTIVVCQPTGCTSYPDGASVLYRTLPPPGPGPVSCPQVGTGAIAMDENGFLYVPSPPWWNMAMNQPNPPGVSTCTWLRFGPGVSTWPNDRPAGQPTQPGPPPPTAVMQCSGPTSSTSDCTGLFYVQLNLPTMGALGLLATPAPPGFVPDQRWHSIQ